MSDNHSSYIKRGLAWVSIVVLAMAISSCGFTPLYGKHGAASSPEVVDALATVAIRPLPNRQGMKLRQVLHETMQPNGLTRADYDLDVVFAQRVEELGIRTDATSSRANMILSAQFTLFEGGKSTYTDHVEAIVSYNILDDQYATVAAQADAESRGIREVGEDIKIRLAVYFHKKLNATTVAASKP